MAAATVACVDRRQSPRERRSGNPGFEPYRSKTNNQQVTPDTSSERRVGTAGTRIPTPDL